MLQDEQTLRRTVAKNIAAYRKSHKDTQLDLARKLNYSDKSVSKWERGEGLPDVYILAQIAQLYGVTVSNLIGEEEPPKKANPHFHIYVLLLSVALVFVIAAILFTAFTIEYVVRGVDIDAAAVARAVELSVENYCSVHAMLHKAAEIQTVITIIQE